MRMVNLEWCTHPLMMSRRIIFLPQAPMSLNMTSVFPTSYSTLKKYLFILSITWFGQSTMQFRRDCLHFLFDVKPAFYHRITILRARWINVNTSTLECYFYLNLVMDSKSTITLYISLMCSKNCVLILPVSFWLGCLHKGNDIICCRLTRNNE